MKVLCIRKGHTKNLLGFDKTQLEMGLQVGEQVTVAERS